jgi:hypothetical protein
MSRGICDDGIACEQEHSTTLNEYGCCPLCEEQRNYENDKFPLEVGA